MARPRGRTSERYLLAAVLAGVVVSASSVFSEGPNLERRFESARQTLRNAAPSPEQVAAAVEVLIEALDDPSLQWSAGQTLAELGPVAAPAVPRLTQRVLTLAEGGEIEDPQGTPAWVLSRIGAPAIPALVALLREQSPVVRWLAVWALGEMGASARPAVPSLIVALGDPIGWVRAAAADAIGSTHPIDDAAVFALVRALSDPEQDLRAAAARALGQHGRLAEGALPNLRALDDPAIRLPVEDAITAIETDRAGWRLRPTAENIPFLISAAVSARSDSELLPVAAALGEIGRPAAPELITALSRHREPVESRTNLLIVVRYLGPAAGDAVPLLVEALTAAEPWVRHLACDALSAVGPAAAPALPKLEQLLNDPNGAVRSRAAAAIEGISAGS